MPSITSAVRRVRSVVTWLTSTPSLASASRTKRPICSLPTRVSMAERVPRRARPAARLPDEPPRYLAKLCMSSSRPPNCSPYKSTAARPRQMTSSVLSVLTASNVRIPEPGVLAHDPPVLLGEFRHCIAIIGQVPDNPRVVHTVAGCGALGMIIFIDNLDRIEISYL